MNGYQRIIISRTDSIGDIVLTLPLAGMLKSKFPESEIYFLGRSYTHEVIKACKHVDVFLNWDEISSMQQVDAIQSLKDIKADLFIHVFPRSKIAQLAKKAGIPERLGTTNRFYHWYTCNKLVRLSRRKSSLHEAQLNIKLIERITNTNIISLDEIPNLYGLNKLEPLNSNFAQLIDNDKRNIILHPKSKGSAREWGVNNFIKLIGLLPEKEFKLFVSGTKEEGDLIRPSGIFESDHVTDLSGKMSLGQLMSFIKSCDSLVAASTGPLHLAAALGVRAIGIYPPIKPMHPGRWAPVGNKASFVVKEKDCDDCRKQGPCHCMEEITAEEIIIQLTKT